MNRNTIKAKPFLKWAGGKSQLLPRFRELYPAGLGNGSIKHYREPFLGGAAVFFDIVQEYPVKSARLYDINGELVTAYRVIQRDVDRLIDILEKFSGEYKALDEKKRRACYYDMREAYNRESRSAPAGRYSEEWITRTALMIFLNKTCYNGLYRVNSDGDFNVPAGSYKNPAICDRENLLAVSRVLQKAEIIHGNFTEAAKRIPAGTFVYCDPPYRPISRTSSFTSYSRYSFTDDDQRKLAEMFCDLDEKGALVMLSNSDPKNENPDDDFFDELYRGYRIDRVDANRMINCNGSRRGLIREVVVRNYGYHG